MEVKLLGVQDISFKDSEGRSIVGTNIFCGYADENVQGIRTDKFFLKEGIDLPKDTKLNEILNISFNQKGKVESIEKTSN